VPIAKQPPVILKPTFEVEVALPEMLSPESVVVPNPRDDTDSSVAVDDPTTSPSVSPASGLTERRAVGDEDEIERAPVKYDVAVVVARMFPTVNCVPVANRAVPAELEKIRELIG
jgi:hypothetical protein